ncbi:hypothetical protein FBEOM_13903 [Fusarium beomiforme]|uniref:Uncharacterized protein n=1 Tax=Fusarium beomiforme TaxID=44412 RepID=A0A9P5A4Z9_9HYPO|nr:hypothetical protein FBEOM_13903 [Fusarium beomiforme]
MPKRSIDAANIGGSMKPVPTRKVKRVSLCPHLRIVEDNITDASMQTERSHEENQERAYIAASRRADRSLEARVQSARMASEIHKKRTGKAFRITEEIVMKEEMYEEEDDEFPRSYRLLKQSMQTSNPAFNARVDAYLTNRVAMSQIMTATENDWRNNEINMEFAKMFPQAQQQAQSLSHRWSTPGYSVPHARNNTVSTPMEQHFDPNFKPINYGQPCNNIHGDRSHSISGLSPSDSRTDAAMSPPALTPGSGSHPETPQSRCISTFANVHPPPMMEFNSDNSAFTAELPPEAKMLMGGVGMNDTFSPSLYSEPHNWGAPQSYGYGGDSKYFKDEDADLGVAGDNYPEISDSIDWDGLNTPTKHYGDQDPAWDCFLNDNWSNEQQQ